MAPSADGRRVPALGGAAPFGRELMISLTARVHPPSAADERQTSELIGANDPSLERTIDLAAVPRTGTS